MNSAKTLRILMCFDEVMNNILNFGSDEGLMVGDREMKRPLKFKFVGRGVICESGIENPLKHSKLFLKPVPCYTEFGCRQGGRSVHT